MNAGTWRRVYRPTQALQASHEFIAADSFTLLAFYQADERSGRSHETWSGTLAPSSFGPVRADAASDIRPAGSIAQPIGATSPIRAPQFAGASRGAALARGY
jgi:hypothetical protein